MLVTLTLPTSTAWSPEKSMPQYCWNRFESVSAVYSVLLDPGQVMLDLSGVADAEAEDDVGVPVEVGPAVMNIVVAAGLFAVLVGRVASWKRSCIYPARMREKTHDSVALARSACALCRFRWLTPKPALSPITAAMRIRSAAIRAKHEPRFVPDDAAAPDAGCEYTAGGGAWPYAAGLCPFPYAYCCWLGCPIC